MTRKSIMIFIEGEGGGGTPSKRKNNNGEFRNSWKLFLQPLADLAEAKGVAFFKCIPGRGGTNTLDTFSKPLPRDEGALRILLIDSEGPVNELKKPWDVLGRQPPAWADDDSCYLMVQCLETWLLADLENLIAHYNKSKKCFNEKKMKSWRNLEATPRKTIQLALEQATADCARPYSHADGNFLIALVRRDKLKSLASVTRLFEDLEKKILEYAEA